jgi:ABC-type lipoprotein release transport system permease subunit
MNWFDKQRNILDFTLSSLLRRKGKNLSLFVAYTFIIFVLASVIFFTYALKREACLVLNNSPEVVVQRSIAGRNDLIPLSYADKVKAIRGVLSVRGRLWGYYYEPSVGANYTMIVPEDRLLETGTVVIGKGVSRTLHAEVGDVISLRSYDGSYMSMEIKEILSSKSELVSSDLILVPEDDFRELFGIPSGYVSDLTLRVRNPREIITIANKIKRLLPDTRPIARDEILRTYNAIFDWRSGIIMVIISGAVAAFIIFAWDKATGLSSEERREIGILKGIGWETSDIMAMKFWEGCVVSLSSFLLGIILAYFHVFLTSAVLFSPVLKGWSVLYPNFRLVPFIDFYQIATLFFLTTVPYTVATIAPSWRAATVDPDSVMRL